MKKYAELFAQGKPIHPARFLDNDSNGHSITLQRAD
jgi:hypothetical protein